jgi:hypothetical protein
MRCPLERARLAAVIVSVAAAAVGLLGACGSESNDITGGGLTTAATEVTDATSASAAAPGATAPTGPEDSAPAGTAEVEQAVRDTFDAYRATLLAEDGEAAVAFVTPNTVTWYDGIRELALSAPPDVLEDPSTALLDAVTVIQMRAILGPEVVRTSDGRELFVIGVERGLVGSDVATTQLDGVEEVGPGEAYGTIGGTRAFRFENQGDGWRIDLESALLALADAGGEDDLVDLLSGGSASTRLELFEALSASYGTTWAEVAQPLS